MAKILAIYTSMKADTKYGSISMKALKKWLDFYKIKNPKDEIINLDLNLDEVGQDVLTSKNFHNFFDNSDKYIDQLKEVNKVVIASPMTNFNYPAPLKNYLDHILVAKKTFIYKYDAKGKSEGLLKHLKVQLITTQGAPKGWYPFGDHTISLKGTWEFMGTHVVEPVIIAGTKTPEFSDKSSDDIVLIHENQIKKSAENF